MNMLHIIIQVLTMYFLPLLGFEENVHKKVNSASRLNMLHTVLPTEFCPLSNWSPKQHCFGPKRLTKGKDIRSQICPNIDGSYSTYLLFFPHWI